MLIFVRTLIGESITIETEACNTVEHIKHSIRDKKGIPVEAMKLVFAGKEIQDHRIIGRYGIQKGSTIHLIFRSSDGKYRPGEMKHLEDLRSTVKQYMTCRISWTKLGNAELPVSNKCDFSSILDAAENGPLRAILSFLDFIDLVTNIPNVCNSFDRVSKFCLSQGIVKLEKYHSFGVLFEDKIYVSEPLLIHKIFKLCKNHFYFDSKLFDFMISRKYRKAIFHFFKNLKQRVKESDTVLITKTFNIFLSYSSREDVKDKEMASMIFEEFNDQEIVLSAFRVLGILDDLQLTTFEEFFNLDNRNEEHSESCGSKKKYNFRISPSKYDLGVLFRRTTENSEKLFRMYFRILFPSDEYSKKYRREREMDKELLEGFKYRFDRLNQRFLWESLFGMGYGFERKNLIEHPLHVEKLKFMCSSEINIIPTEEEREVIDECFPSIPSEMWNRIKHNYKANDEERYQNAYDYKLKHKIKNEKLREEGKPCVRVYSEELDFEKRKDVSQYIIARFWFPKIEGEFQKEVFSKLCDFFAIDCRSSEGGELNDNSYSSFLTICPFRFEIERFIWKNEFNKTSQQGKENYKKLKGMVTDYFENMRENDPFSGNKLHPNVSRKVEGDKILKRILRNKFYS